MLSILRPLSLSCLFSFSLILASGLIIQPLQAQESNLEETTNLQDNDNENPEANEVRALSDSDSFLTLKGGKKLMDEAQEAIVAEKYDLATSKLQQARKVFNQLSNFYLQLANSFSGIDNDVFEEQRRNALTTGQMRDQATYQLALVHRAQEQPELAVPLLIQIIRSQNPTTELGKKSYQQLYELGFVEAPYSRSSN